jgi:uncharacterized GH25 family protein
MVAVAACSLFAAVAGAHDFWLITDFAPRPNRLVRIVAHTGDSFPVGEFPVEIDRIARFDITGIRGVISADHVRELEKTTEADAMLPAAGTYVIAVEIKPRFLQLKASEFNEYLNHEGLSQILEARRRDGKEGSDGRELYAKFAKAIVHADGKADGAATRVIGLRLEIVPGTDPHLVPPGGKLPVRVLFDGKPLAGALVAWANDATRAGKAEESGHETRTNRDGMAEIPIHTPGIWIVNLVHMIRANGQKGHDWESFFSTLTFQVAPKK